MHGKKFHYEDKIFTTGFTAWLQAAAFFRACRCECEYKGGSWQRVPSLTIKSFSSALSDIITMRFALHLFALFLAVSTATATLLARQTLPSCAGPCLTNANTGTCTPDDDTCLCQDASFISSTTACIQSACSGSDLVNAEAYAQALCAAVGITLTISSPSATGATTATSSASSATPTTSSSSGAPMTSTISVLAGAVAAVAIAAVL